MTRHAENEASSVSHGRQHRESRFESGLPALQGAARWINVVNVAVGFCGGYCVRYVVASMASIGRSVKEGNMDGCGKWFDGDLFMGVRWVTKDEFQDANLASDEEMEKY